MANPVGMRCKVIPSSLGGAVHVYSSSQRIVIQVRREVPTEIDVLGSSFKSAVEITCNQALALASELLAVVSNRSK